jgi:hypothetical protein
MKQAKFFILIFGFIIAFILSSCGDNGIVAPDNGTSLIDTILDVSTKDVTLKLNNKIEILFPKGSVVSGTNLKITENPSISVMSTLEYNVLKVYDVSLSNNAKLLKPITITFSYDQVKLSTGVFSKDIKAAYFNDALSKWSFYQTTIIDSIKKTISFVTSHLTPLGFAEFISSGGYQQKFVSTHFQVYYTNASANKVMSNDAYGASDQPWRIKSGANSSTPFYVQDLSHWLEEAFERYQSFYKFELPKDTNSKINVYIKAIVGADGEYGSITGVIYVNNNMVKLANVQDLSYPELLKSVAAHELMHYVQDNYYVMNKGGYTLWWLEATASNADYMVWGSQLKHSESYCWSENINNANGSVLAYNISRSWDNCTGSPFHYVAGCFLSYLTNYSNIKFDLANLIKIAGNDFDLSSIRNILDNNLRTNYSTNVGEQYDKYVNWLFVRSNIMSLKYSTYSSIPNPDNAVEFPMVLDKNNKKATYDKSLPYLSANVIKIKPTDDSLRVVRIKAVSIPTDIYVYLYNSGVTSSLNKELKNGDSIDITIPIKQIKDLVVINRSKDNNLKPTITVELVTKSDIMSSISKMNTIEIDLNTDFNFYGANISTVYSDTKGITLYKINIDGSNFTSSGTDIRNRLTDFDTKQTNQETSFEFTGQVDEAKKTIDITYFRRNYMKSVGIAGGNAGSLEIDSNYQKIVIKGLPYTGINSTSVSFTTIGSNILNYLIERKYESYGYRRYGDGTVDLNNRRSAGKNDLIIDGTSLFKVRFCIDCIK